MIRHRNPACSKDLHSSLMTQLKIAAAERYKRFKNEKLRDDVINNLKNS